MLVYSTQIKYSIISVFGSVSPSLLSTLSVQHQFSTSGSQLCAVRFMLCI